MLITSSLIDKVIKLLHHLEPINDYQIDVGDNHIDLALLYGATGTVLDIHLAAMRHYEVKGHLTALKRLDVSLVADHF